MAPPPQPQTVPGVIIAFPRGFGPIYTCDAAYSPLQIAEDYLNEGWAPIPNPYRAKHPKIPKWQNLIVTRDNLNQHFNNRQQNIGVLLGHASGGLRDVDLDCAEAIALGKLFLPPGGPAFGRQSARRSHWLYYVHDVPDNIQKGLIAFNDPNKEREKKRILEIRLGPGVQTIFPGSAHEDTGEAITWDTKGKPQEIPFAALHEACAKTASGVLLIRAWPAQGTRNEAALALGGLLARCGWDEHEIGEFVLAVAELANDEQAQERAQSAASAAGKLSNGEPVAGLPRLKELFDDKPASQIAKWLGYTAARHTDAGPEFTEDKLALEFANRHARELRYVAAWSKWLMWDTTRWRFEETLAAFDLARKICREAASQSKSEAKNLCKARTVAAVETLARADRRMAATKDQWDTGLLHIGGMMYINLESGGGRESRPEDYCTKKTAVSPAEGKPTMFLAFLDRIMDGNKELISYLQRLFGYCCTGLTTEQAMAFFYGTGANGKSVLLSTVSGILGDYHKTAAIETFTVQAGANHPTDLAHLMGARLVTAIETEEGRRWAEAKIKALTGGDEIPARFMRQDFFTFKPQFKLIVAGNHKPSLRTVDEAMRRRLHMVPFAVTIPERERVPDLAEKLKAEWPQILSWMLEGCREWLRIGLAPPKAVNDATAAYFEAQDSVAAWIDERCDIGANYREPRTALFLSWKDWAEKAGEFAGSQRDLFDKLEGKGLRHVRTALGRTFQGIRLKVSDDTDWRARA